ncbi:MAG: hypothetical protein UR12_C0043G0014 [candidate division TM6 bacterium GW2011_GWF2_30_66]|nr:MAG: hypothetical protein UR12_C0043G0014 [candidate division TM6 bacterium GW2011_GWF2_30_66]
MFVVNNSIGEFAMVFLFFQRSFKGSNLGNILEIYRNNKNNWPCDKKRGLFYLRARLQEKQSLHYWKFKCRVYANKGSTGMAEMTVYLQKIKTIRFFIIFSF